MLKIVFYIVLAIAVIYVTAYAVLFVVAAVMYRTGRLTKADLDRASKEYRQKKERKKNMIDSRRRKRKGGSTDILHIAMGEW